MSLDPLLPIAPARVKALLLPLGQIKAERFSSFVDRLNSEHVVHLRDVTPDGRPNRNMFSPLAYPDGAVLYEFINHIPPPSHTALAPFDLYREPLAVIALADGKELEDVTFSKRNSANGPGPSVVEKNIRALYQELEELRDQYPKALVHRVLIFDYVAPTTGIVPIPDEGMSVIPPQEDSLRTTIKTVMCTISSLMLAEMTTLAKSFEAMTAIESPAQSSVTRAVNGMDGAPNGMARRNSQFSLPQSSGRSSSVGQADKAHARMSMPPVPSSRTNQLGSASSTPGRPSTPVKRPNSGNPLSPDSTQEDSGSGPPTPDQNAKRPDTVQGTRNTANDKVSVQGFGPGGANDRWRLRGKGRATVIIGSMYLQAGRWSDSLRELAEGATAARSLNDHIWHGKALELILMNLLLLGWSKLDFQIPQVCLPTQEGPNKGTWPKADSQPVVADQPKHIRNLQLVLPDLLERIINLYSRRGSDVEKLPPLAFAETTIRFCKILSAMHLCSGTLNERSLEMIISGKLPAKELTTSPRLHIVPTRQQILNLLFGAFPSSPTSSSELLTTVDRATILSGIASVLSPLGFRRKKAMVIRELISVLITGLVEARTRGAADAGVHPAAGLVSLAHSGTRNGIALDLNEGDIEQGIEAFLDLLCKSYGVVGLDRTKKPGTDTATGELDSDEAIINRIYGQSGARFFGFAGIKLNILRACINFSEALPDFNGVLKFSSDLLRTAGAGIAPGSRREDSSPIIWAEEQARLTANISKTWGLAQQFGIGASAAEYWDEFLVRDIKLEPLPSTRTPIPHAHSALPGAAAGRTSQDVDPFIYNPFLKKPDEVVESFLVANEVATFRLNLQNTYDMEVEIESIRLETTGSAFESFPEATRLGPNRTQLLKLKGKPKEEGSITVTGAIIKVRGCRERRFPVFNKAWAPVRDVKIKARGQSAIDEGIEPIQRSNAKPETKTLNLTAIEAQPLVTVKSMTLPQSSVMILEGERRIFSITLQNNSTTPVDFMLFTFKDSTQEPLQAALKSRDSTPAELHEYELILLKKQALRLPKSNQKRYIEAGGEATFDFEILGKPGLTEATIQVDYTHLGVAREEVTEQFYTRQVSVDLTVTVNASVELSRVDVLPMDGPIPQSYLAHLNAPQPTDLLEYCWLLLDVRNAWPSQMAVHFEDTDGLIVNENVLPGNTSRVLIPIKRVFLEDPHASIPSLNPVQDRQFVVSSSKITPELERSNREAFWYREKILERIKSTWATTSTPKRTGTFEIRNIRLTPRMVEAVKIDEVGIDISLEDSDADQDNGANIAYVDEFFKVKVLVTNQTSKPISPLVRLLPALCHRPSTVALDHTRKLAWNGTLQQLLPKLQGHESTEFVMGMTALCRGEFEFTATVEEVMVHEDKEQASRDSGSQGGRQRSDTQTAMDAALGVQERRVWHSRQPFILTARDRE